MTEAEWLACDDPLRILTVMVNQRALRLFAVAGCHRVWHLLSDRRSRDAVEVAERYADGHATEDERNAAFEAAVAAVEQLESEAYGTVGTGVLENPAIPAAASAANAVDESLSFDAEQADLSYLVDNPVDALRLEKVERGEHGTRKAELLVQVSWLRCIFGNPFRPATFSPEWRTNTAFSLARQMYDSREFDAMPILADALQDAGCDSEDILGHCRGPGPHVRGCWVVDLVLGKE